MNELTDTKLKRPLDKLNMGHDVAALNALLSFMNNTKITGAVVPKGVSVKAGEVASAPAVASAIAKEDAKFPGIKHGVDPNPLRVTLRNPQRIFYTGLIGAGKDFVAEQTEAKIFGFADPLYHLAEYFFGISVNSKQGKDIPGVRQFLQAAGQWGRGEINEQYPFTPSRACFVSMIRSLGEAGRFNPQYCIDWAEYGKNKDLWLDGCNQRVEQFLSENSGSRVAITNCRFSNEFKRLKELGWQHTHIMCSPETRAKRVTVGANSKDVSEQLANFLNSDVTKRISAQPKGAKLRVIWNDSAPAPSPRLYSVAEFLQSLNVANAEELIVTGE